MSSELAPLELLTRTPYVNVLTYPRVSLRSARSRVNQLQKLGVTALAFRGHAKIGRLGILGLGTVGVVVEARAGPAVFALKIRRTDANRPSMEEEFRITALANRLGIGPRAEGRTRDFLLMELLEFVELSVWLKGLGGPGKRNEARLVVHSLLNQCRTLDIMGIDHGQLSDLRKHVVVAGSRPYIIDFESAGTDRRPKNVTSAAQHLFIGGLISPALRRTLGLRETGTLRQLLAAYKESLSDFAYAKVLEHLKLQ
jgi:putative serine/threonine protein kinase